MIRIMEVTYLGEAGVSPLVIADYVEDILEEVDCNIYFFVISIKMFAIYLHCCLLFV